MCYNGVMKRDAVLNVRIPADLKEALVRAAEEDHGRTMSGMLVRILDEWLGSAGYLKKSARPSRKNKKE